MKKRKKPSRQEPQTKGKQLHIRVTEEEFRQMQGLAELYSEGNVSRWIRYSARFFRPAKRDLL